jgi:hypothetical protein
LWIEKILGTDPQPPPPHIFALDLPSGDHEGQAGLSQGPDGNGETVADQGRLRYGSFHRGPQSFVYASHQEIELPPGLFGVGPLGAPLRDAHLFGEKVQQIVNSLEGPLKEAALVLPDRWLRLNFTEITTLPRRPRDIQDVLRFKLKRLVPFRVEDLRVSATEVYPFPNQEEPRRLLLGFALDTLLTQLEDAFAAVGVELGRITNTTLALIASLEHNLSAQDLAALITVQPGAYTVCYFQAGEPLLYRYKALPESTHPSSSVRRDLRLTSGFVSQHFPDRPLSRLYLAAPEESEERWLDWLTDEFEIVPEPLAFGHFDITRTQVGPTWMETAPLLGAASLEV